MAVSHVKFKDLTAKLVTDLAGVNKEDVERYIHSDQGSLALLQWKLLANLQKRPHKDTVVPEAGLSQILSDISTLELLLTSGYVQDNKWTEVIGILTQIFDLDPEAHSNGYRLRLAVAVAVTFSSPVKSMASYGRRNIPAIARYQHFRHWAEAGLLFPHHLELSTWHLRYVITWQ